MPRANEQTLIIERDIARLADDHKKLNERFDRHLEIYAQNGKELASLKVAVENLRSTIIDHAKSSKESHETMVSKAADNTNRITSLEIDVSRLAVKVGAYATVGSALASSTAVFIIEKLLV